MSQSASTDVEQRLERLTERGVVVVDPRQTWIGPEIQLERISAGAVLHPGTRLTGRLTFIGARARVGSEGPAALHDMALAEGAEFASGVGDRAVLLEGARVGANAHLRAGTLLEEQASTAHCVGLKQSILLPFVTLGSLINFCDCLIAGGTSRDDHSEVGSGYIHFNFTPWGERGDKATASLIGDVVNGVFLRERRIFLGGMGGLVGPVGIGYGAVAAAGQVLRREVDSDTFALRVPRAVERPAQPGFLDRLQPRLRKNVAFVAQLFALREWYRQVRLARLGPDDVRRPPVVAGLAAIESCIDERRRQLERFVAEREGVAPRFAVEPGDLPRVPWSLGPDLADHLDWVRSLDQAQVQVGRAWLMGVAQMVQECAEREIQG